VEHGVTGWVVDVNAPAQFADRLEWVMDNPDEAKAMGLAGPTKNLPGVYAGENDFRVRSSVCQRFGETEIDTSCRICLTVDSL
jgi:glycosyltransferase involved in cell wall biosynthesis